MHEEIIRQHLSTGMKKWAMEDARVDNRIHVSNLVEFCPRQFAYYQLSGNMYNEARSLSVREILTFKIGDAIHDIIKYAARLSGISIVEEIHMKIESGEFAVTGSADLIVSIKEHPKELVLEIKSIAKSQFDLLDKPLLPHEFQISTYLYLLEQMERSNTETSFGYVVYVSKEVSPSPIKVFRVDRAEIFLTEIKAQLAEVKIFSETGELPNKVCSSHLSAMARKCVFNANCFKKGE